VFAALTAIFAKIGIENINSARLIAIDNATVKALAGPAGGTDLSEGRHQRIGHRAVVRRVRAGRHAGRDRRPPQLPPELCKFQRDADPGL
jgi:hypothetical protein